MNFKKKVGFVLSLIAIILVFSSTVFAKNKTISEVSFVFKPPYNGGARIELDDITISEGTKSAGFTWVNKRTHVFMQSTEKYEKGGAYAIRMFFEPQEGYDFAPMDELKVTVNNREAEIEFVKEPSQYKFEMEFYSMTEEQANEVLEHVNKPQTTKPDVEEHPLKTIEVKVDVPVAGTELPEKCQIKTNLTGKYIEYEIGKKAEDGFYPYWDTKFFPGLAYGNVSYDFRVKLFDDSISPAQSLKIEGYINGEDCYGGRNQDGSINLFTTYTTGEMPRVEKEKIKEIAFKITEPKVGKKPATTALAINEGYKASKVVWIPADDKFVGGKEYTVQITIELTGEFHLDNNYYATINGQKVEMPNLNPNVFTSGVVYCEMTFPKLEGAPEEAKEEKKEETPKKIEWTKASNWAVEELNKANEKELIPEIFEQQDLTTNITRREFAHIAVKLWESVSGQTMAPGPKAPFSDCDDPEVLKAYNLEITKGTSDTTFSPDELITREQMATMMTRALQKAGIDTSVDIDKVEKFADDNDIHSWGKESVYYMSSIGIIKGVGNNNFGVTGDASKEQSLLISVRSAERFGK